MVRRSNAVGDKIGERLEIVTEKMEYKFDCKSEEDVKVKVVLPFLYKSGYNNDQMEFEKTIEVNEGRKKKSIYADIIVYTSKKKDTPIIVIDTKSPSEILSSNGRDQVISYARLLPKIAPIAVLTNGINTQVFQTIDKTRIKEIPSKNKIAKDFTSTLLGKNIKEALASEARKTLFTIDDVGTFKSLLRRCHNIIRNNEGYDPIQAFDEMSKIIFAKMYEEKYHNESNRFTYELFEYSLTKLKVNIVQQMYKDIHEAPEFKELFPNNDPINLKDRTIGEIVKIFESYDFSLSKFDVKGEAFEYFLGDTFTGGLGEYFTPRNIVEFIVDAISPKIGDKIVDPFCGTGGFLIYAFERISEKIRLRDFSEDESKIWKEKLSNESLFGTDWKERNSQSCKMNMIIHGDGRNGVFKHDGFVDVTIENKENKDEPIKVIGEEMFNICFTNPPFGAFETNTVLLNEFELGKNRNSQAREILAIERVLRLVKKGTGIVAMVLPDGLLNGDRNKYVREYIHRNAEVMAVIGLNKETFEGYNTKAKTSIIFMRRKEQESDFNTGYSIFMAVCSNSGYAPNGMQIPGNELPDILMDWQQYQKDPSSFSPFFKNTKVVTITSATERLDAESHIALDIDFELDFNDTLNKLKTDSSKLNALIRNISQTHDVDARTVEYDYYDVCEILEEVKNIQTLTGEIEYFTLGISGKGNGLFLHPEGLYKRDRLNKVELNWFAYSRLFAHNGSFAYVTKDFEGHYLSNEFPTFKVKNVVHGDLMALLDYLCYYFSSPQVTAYINRMTTGSTKESRARFKSEQFLQLRIAIPHNKEDFFKIVTMIRKIKSYKKAIKLLNDQIEDLPASYKYLLPFEL